VARLIPAALALVAFTVVFSGDVFARGDSSGPIHACASKKDGAVRIVGPKRRCKQGEVAVSWARAGVAGPRGPEGVPGPRGPSGPTGATGVAGAQLVDGTAVTSTSGSVGTVVTADASCPSGTVLLGGGGKVTNNDTHPDRTVLTQSYPLDGTTWHAVGVIAGENLSGGHRMTVQAFARCS
jgi:hypothetical protein